MYCARVCLIQLQGLNWDPWDARSNASQLTVLLAHDPISSLAYPVITHTPLVSDNLPIDTLVARWWPLKWLWCSIRLSMQIEWVFLQKCVVWLIVFCQTMVQLYDIWPMALLIELSSSPTNSVAHNESHGSQPQELVHDYVLCVCDDRKEMLCRLIFVILKWCLPLATLNIALYCSYQHSIKASSSFIKHLIMLTYLDDI